MNRQLLHAVLIDPTVQLCTDIAVDHGNSYRQLRDLIGCDTAGAFYPSIVGIPGYDGRFICWIDDNGYLHDEIKPLWEIKGYHEKLTGRGVLIGLDNEEGDHINCPLPADVVQRLITWRTDIEFVGMVTKTVEGEMHPVLGLPSTTITTNTVFKKKGETDDQG